MNIFTETSFLFLLREIATALGNIRHEKGLLEPFIQHRDRLGLHTLALFTFPLNAENVPTGCRWAAWWQAGEWIDSRSLPEAILHPEDMPFTRGLLDTPTAPIWVVHVETAHFTETERAFIQQQQMQAFCTLPLHHNQRWIGAITLGWNAPHPFSAAETTLFETLTPILALAASHQRIQQAHDTIIKESEARAGEMEIVYRVSAAAAQRLDINLLLQEVVNLTQKEFNLYHAHIYLTDEQEEKLLLSASAFETLRAMQARGFKLDIRRDTALAAVCARTREGMIVNDVARRREFVPNPLLPETRSQLLVPLLMGDKLMGVLDLHANKPNRFNRYILSTMTILAQQLAIAIQNARLFEQEREVAEELRRVDKLKTQFLANMSHELRTPLNAILNFTHFVVTEVYGPVNAEQVENLQKVTNSAGHLLGLINDILDLSKIEAGMMNLFVEEINMNQVVRSAIATAQALPRPEEVTFQIEVDTLPNLRGDKRRIRQILLNLLSNALKFTEQGQVRFKATLHEKYILFSVEDSGPGIAASHLEMIFEPFRQTEDGLSKGGTGLGLPISRYLAEAHGGRLWVSSVEGRGSIFYVLLPIKTDLVLK